jgi:hypothetical protein
MKTIIVAPHAAKDFDALSAQAREAVEKGLARKAVEGFGDVKRLQGDLVLGRGSASIG